MLALIYIDRLIQRNNFILSGLNVHRVVITSVMLAAKFFDDQVDSSAQAPPALGTDATGHDIRNVPPLPPRPPTTQYFNNAYYAKVGGVPCVELNQLEVDFLFRVNFSLRVTSDDFFRVTIDAAY